MKQRRIAPTLALLTAVGAVGAVACLGIEPSTQLLGGLWQSIAGPSMARAEDNAPSTAGPVIQNPFAIAAAEEPVAAGAPQPEPAPSAESYLLPAAPQAAAINAAMPSLEPIPQRRTNPQLAEPEIPAEQALPKQIVTTPAQKQKAKVPMVKQNRRVAETVAVEPVKERMPARQPNRFAEPQYVVPVTHNDPIAAPAYATDHAYASDPEVPAVSDMPYATPEPAPTPAPARMSGMSRGVELSADARPVSRGGLLLEWVLPESVTVGQEANCQLHVRNTSDAAAYNVMVEAQMPAEVELGACEPRAGMQNNLLVWELGDMAPGGSTTARISFTPRREGDVTPRAAVTCTHQAAAAMRAVESRLALSVEGPQEAIVGQPSSFCFRVKNEGSGAAVGVAIDMELDEALEAAGGKPRYNIGSLGPGESRHVQVSIVGSRQGEYAVRSQVVSADAVKDAVTHAVRIVKPALAVSLEGPKLRFVDRKASYVIKVQNPGPVAIDNVQVLESIPEGLRFVEATSGGSYDRQARQVAWFVGRLEANETASVGVQLIATEAGEQRLSAAAAADFGVLGETETVTEVKGAPRVVIDVTEDDDPVEVDGETVYRIRLSNIGSMPARRVQFAAEAPREMQVLDVHGPDQGTIKGQQVVFPPVPMLEPGQALDYDVRVRCTKAGAARFRAYFRSEDTPNPVLEEEATRIYAD